MRFLDRIDREWLADRLDRDEYFWLDLDASSDADVQARSFYA